MLAKTFWGYRQELPSPHRAGYLGSSDTQSPMAGCPPALHWWWGHGRKGSTGPWHTRRAQSQCQQLLALVRDKQELKSFPLPHARHPAQ